MRSLKQLLATGIFIFFSVAFVNAFSKENIISPVEGTWNNPQPLIIDVPEGWDVYFSYSSSNPLESGLFYDFPVENEQTGNITLYVIAVDPEGNRTAVNVNFTVNPVKPFVRDLDAGSYFSEINKGAIITLPAGKRFSIPNGYKYCLGRNKKPSLEAKDFFVSENNMLEKYVPCTISDGKSIWRFVIHSVTSIGEGDFEQTAPFIISNWNEISFMNDDYIYQLDDEYWSGSTKKVTVDRTVPHVIRWQSVEYEFGNEVYSVDLPKKPELNMSKTKRGSLVYSVKDNDKFQLKANNKHSVEATIPDEIFKSIEIDVFDGDESMETVEFSVYYEGLYQGTLKASYILDRQSPDSPDFISTADDSFVREKVKVSISSQPDVEVYYAVSNPITSLIGFDGAGKEVFDSVQTGSYKRYDGRTFTLSSVESSATFYKICAYAKDIRGNESTVSEYRVVIDDSNYYLSTVDRKINLLSENKKEIPDGSASNPFTSLEQALDVINQKPYAKLHIKGNVEIKQEEINIFTNCSLVGNQTHITVPALSVINIVNSNFEAVGCIFEKNISQSMAESYVPEERSAAVRNIFNVKNSKAVFDDCDINGIFGHEGVLISAEKSVLSFRNCGLTSNAFDYSCVIASTDTDVEGISCDFTSVASTVSCISATKGRIQLNECMCSVIGHLCHVAELNTSYAEFYNNNFYTKKDSSSLNNELIWKNADAVLIQKGNLVNGEY